ncbi:carbamoyltransferase C-terminal domain-containing protein [Nocardia sp. NPDC057440]|uniref:carbamoyltransferase C-terminal domain-containing protein n=1 Tax=Nocardia sp. NPDC057440 TaxID=3346134 RepID=UPI0036703AD0
MQRRTAPRHIIDPDKGRNGDLPSIHEYVEVRMVVIPAILHLDRTARLQTIDPTANSAAARVLSAYERISGIPVLCNASANLHGRGFFPDVASAARWGGTRYIWSAGMLYANETEHHGLQHDSI